MKTKFWIYILIAVVAVCLVLSCWLLRPTQATAVEVWSDGALIQTLPLTTDTEVRVESAGGVNIVTVREGKVAVTEADCPDEYCIKRGFCSGGTQIVCLPNRLVLKFVGVNPVDGVAG